MISNLPNIFFCCEANSIKCEHFIKGHIQGSLFYYCYIIINDKCSPMYCTSIKSRLSVLTHHHIMVVNLVNVDLQCKTPIYIVFKTHILLSTFSHPLSNPSYTLLDLLGRGELVRDKDPGVHLSDQWHSVRDTFVPTRLPPGSFSSNFPSLQVLVACEISNCLDNTTLNILS